jgi:hypothetical protein
VITSVSGTMSSATRVDDAGDDAQLHIHSHHIKLILAFIGEWQPVLDEASQSYYWWNTVSGATSWEKPPSDAAAKLTSHVKASTDDVHQADHSAGSAGDSSAESSSSSSSASAIVAARDDMGKDHDNNNNHGDNDDDDVDDDHLHDDDDDDDDEDEEDEDHNIETDENKMEHPTTATLPQRHLPKFPLPAQIAASQQALGAPGTMDSTDTANMSAPQDHASYDYYSSKEYYEWYYNNAAALAAASTGATPSSALEHTAILPASSSSASSTASSSSSNIMDDAGAAAAAAAYYQNYQYASAWTASNSEDHTLSATFNAKTGRFQVDRVAASYFDPNAKAERQMSHFFDINAYQEERNRDKMLEMSAAAGLGVKKKVKLTKKELEKIKQKNKEKKYRSLIKRLGDD